MNMNNIRVTQTINVKIKDVEHNLTFAEATALYNTLGSVLNLGKTWDNPKHPSQPNQPWQPMPYKFPHDIWYGIPPVSYGNTPPMNLCSWNNATDEERKERHDSGLFPNHMCTFV
jgi:hypothetical protein